MFLLALALFFAIFFLLRHLAFYSRYKAVRKENMQMAAEMKKRLKSAKLRSLDEIMDEQEDEMFRKPVKAKPIRIPATYEARVASARSQALNKGKRASRKAPRKRARKARAKQAVMEEMISEGP